MSETNTTCPRCGGELKPGKAFKNTRAYGVRDFPNSDDLSGQTFSYSGSARLVDVLKCSDCGYSRTK